MIRYRVQQVLDLVAASECRHPVLARLRGRGPWAAQHDGGSTVLQRGQAAAWTDWQAGLHGLDVCFADPMPNVESIAWKPTQNCVRVDLGMCHGFALLSSAAPVRLGFDGKPDGWASEYGAVGQRLFDLADRGENLTVSSPELLAFCRHALMACSDLTEELCHAFGLITTESVQAIFEGATGLPKAQGGAG